MRHLCSSVVLLLPTCCWAQPRLDLHGNALPPNAVARCGIARDRPHTPLTTVALASDGKLVAATDGGAVVWLWDAHSGKPRAPLKVGRPMPYLHFSPDSKLLAVGDSCSVQLWDVARGERLTRFTDLTDRCAPAFAADSRTLVLPRSREGVALHDIPSGKQRRFFPDADAGEVAILSPDGKQLALAREGGSIALLDVASGQQLGLLDKHVLMVRALVYARDGKTLLSLGDDGMLRSWDVPRRKEREARRVGQVLSRGLAFGPDDRFILADLGDARIGRLHPTTLESLDQWQGAAKEYLADLSFSADGARATFRTIGAQFSLRFVDTARGREVSSSASQAGAVSAVAFSQDGKLLATSTSLNEVPVIRLWEPRTGKLVRELRGHEDRVVTLGFLDEGKVLVGLSGGAERQVHQWDVATGALLKPPDSIPRVALELAVAPDGKRFAVVGRTTREEGPNFEVGLWDAAGRRLDWNSSWRKVSGLAFRGNGRTVVLDGNGMFQREPFRDLSSNLPRQEDVQPISRRVFAPDDEVVMEVTRENGCVTVRHSQTHALIHDLSATFGKNPPLAVAPNGRVVAVGGNTDTVRLFDLLSGKVVEIFTGHALPGIDALAFSPDGTLLASAGEDATVLVWEVPAELRKQRALIPPMKR